MLRPLLIALAFACAAEPASAQFSVETLRIGVLNNQTGGLAAPAGLGSVVATQMAVEDFGGNVAGHSIAVVSADQQNKPDVALGIARRWFDEGIDLIVDLPNTAVALAVTRLAQERNRVAIVVTAAASNLTGADCTPNSIAWNYNSYALAGVIGRAVVADGGDTWFLLSTDYTFGRTISRACWRKAAGAYWAASRRRRKAPTSRPTFCKPRRPARR